MAQSIATKLEEWEKVNSPAAALTSTVLHQPQFIVSGTVKPLNKEPAISLGGCPLSEVEGS